MEPKELRIGNYVSSPGYSFIKVCGTNLETEEILPEFELLGQGDWWGLDNFAPIPLDAELLQKAGFTCEPIGHNDFDLKATWHKGAFFLNEYTNGDIGYEWGDDADVLDIQHLHQLQNLYFSLVGEELIINL